MKKLLGLFLVLSVLLTACNKDKDKVTPESPASAVEGKYTLKSLSYNIDGDVADIEKLPYTEGGQTLSGTVNLSKVADDKVKMAVTLKITGEEDQVSDFGEYEVRKVGSAYGLFLDDERVGDANGDKIIYNLDSKDFSFKYTAEK